MPNPTSDEIKQAVEICESGKGCYGCPLSELNSGDDGVGSCARRSLRALLSAYEREEKGCEWREEGYEGGTWETSCGKAFSLIDGTPEENEMKHCPYCGGVLKQIAPDSEDDDDEDAAIKAAEEGQG